MSGTNPNTDLLIIERMRCPSHSVFKHEIVPLQQPVVFQGGIDSWRARRWTFDTFAGDLGNKIVHLEEGELFECTDISSDGDIISARRTETHLNEFCRELQRNSDDPTIRYLTEWPIFEHIPELVGDADFTSLDLLSRELTFPTRLFMGAKGSITPLHYDDTPSLTAQICGQKRWTLFSPDQSESLYAFGGSSRLAHFSRANTTLKMQDRTSFPLLQRARSTEIVLEEGDLLYVPSMWWHHVLALSQSISLGVFWK
jgi:hypothetical protein